MVRTARIQKLIAAVEAGAEHLFSTLAEMQPGSSSASRFRRELRRVMLERTPGLGEKEQSAKVLALFPDGSLRAAADAARELLLLTDNQVGDEADCNADLIQILFDLRLLTGAAALVQKRGV